MSLQGTRVLDQDLDLGGRHVFNPGAPVSPTDLVRLMDLSSAGANALGTYLVASAANAPINAVNLGGMGSGFLKSSVTGGVATLSVDASTYLTTTLAASTYETVVHAAATYQVKLTDASGANLTSKFIVQGTADSGLTAAQFLGALGGGLLKNTTTTGVLSIASGNVDFADPGSYYVVTRATVAPANATNLGGLTSGFVVSTVSGAVSTLSIIDTSTYLTTTLAASTYLTIATAASTYQPLLTAASGANLTPKFILQGTSQTGTPNAQFLGALSTGLVKVTTSTGVLSSAAAGTDFADPSAWYVVTRSASAPTNAVNLGGLSTGVLQQTVSGAVSSVAALNVGTGLVPFGAGGVLSTNTHLSVATSASSIALQIGSGGFSSIAAGGQLQIVGTNNSTDPARMSISTTSTTGTAIVVLQNDLGVSGSAFFYQTGSAWAGQEGANTFAICNGATSTLSDVMFISQTGAKQLSIRKDAGVVYWDSTAAVSPSGSSAIRSASGKLQYSENGGAWANFTGALTGHVLTTQADPSLTNSTNLGGLATGLVKSTVSGSVSTISIDSTAYLSGNVGPGAGTIGSAGHVIQDITLDVNGRVTGATSVVAASGGADALGWYVVTKAANAPTDATNLGSLSSGLVRSTVSGGASTISIDTSAYLTTAVTSAIAGTGIGVSASTGAVTFSNTGVTSIVAGSNIMISASTGAVTISAAAPGASGADALGTYVVTSSTHAPANAVNLGALSNGFLRSTVSGGVATINIDASTYLTTSTAASTYLTIATAASTYLTTTLAASTYQPVLSLTAQSVLVSAGGSSVVQDNANFKYNTSTHALTTKDQTITGVVSMTATNASVSASGTLSVGGVGGSSFTDSTSTLTLQGNASGVGGSTGARVSLGALNGQMFSFGTLTLFADGGASALVVEYGGVVVTGGVFPNSTATYDLGGSGSAWKNVWTSAIQGTGTLIIQGYDSMEFHHTGNSLFGVDTTNTCTYISGSGVFTGYNINLFGVPTDSMHGGSGVLRIGQAVSGPTTNPTADEVILYVDNAGRLLGRTVSGGLQIILN